MGSFDITWSSALRSEQLQPIRNCPSLNSFHDGRSEETWIRRELSAVWCGGWGVQDCCGPNRACEADGAEPGRDDPAGRAGPALQRCARLHQAGSPDRGSISLLERKLGERAPVFPNPGSQLRFQGYDQGDIQDL